MDSTIIPATSRLRSPGDTLRILGVYGKYKEKGSFPRLYEAVHFTSDGKKNLIAINCITKKTEIDSRFSGKNTLPHIIPRINNDLLDLSEVISIDYLSDALKGVTTLKKSIRKTARWARECATLISVEARISSRIEELRPSGLVHFAKKLYD